MLVVIMLGVIFYLLLCSVSIRCLVILSVIMLSVVMLNVIILSVVMLNAVVPIVHQPSSFCCYPTY